ncbi:MAG TPA: divalent-cation tolerance protein CutA [Gemmatimonadales bacterium]|nr:divalent-cation tolerance protein CutA [Gemmatimonadales bacterium]
MAFPSYVTLITAVADRETAERIADTLVAERLAACAQVLGPQTSVYRWKGAVERASEWRLELKTAASRLSALERRLLELHPYEVPECIALPIVHGSDAYLRWLAEETESA